MNANATLAELEAIEDAAAEARSHNRTPETDAAWERAHEAVVAATYRLWDRHSQVMRAFPGRATDEAFARAAALAQ